MSSRELDRLRRVYRGRMRPDLQSRYSLDNPGARYIAEGARRSVARLLADHGSARIGEWRILDVGCGRGQWLGFMIGLGARAEDLWGVDLMEDFLSDARRACVQCNLAIADGAQLPFPSKSFDLVLQMTVFTSILDGEMRRAAAAEMSRVVRPGGIILWYDFRYPNPRNSDVSAIGRRGIRRLFPDHRITTRTATLLPPIAHALAGHWPSACRVLESAPCLRSHIVAIIEPPSS